MPLFCTTFLLLVLRCMLLWHPRQGHHNLVGPYKNNNKETAQHPGSAARTAGAATCDDRARAYTPEIVCSTLSTDMTVNLRLTAAAAAVAALLQ